jgi:osmotically-inducible protein OsmY
VDDAAIRAQLLRELRQQSWWRPAHSFLTVADGTVIFTGTVDSAEERDAARIAAENIAGVRAVEDNRLVFRELPSMV